MHFTCCAVEYNCKLYRVYVSNSNPFVGRGYITASDYTLALIIHMNMQTNKQNEAYSYCNTSRSGRNNVMKYFLLLMEPRHIPILFPVKINQISQKYIFCFYGALFKALINTEGRFNKCDCVSLVPCVPYSKSCLCYNHGNNLILSQCIMSCLTL